jgi:hypothetical protein
LDITTNERRPILKPVLHKGAIGLALVLGGMLAGGLLPSVKVAHGEIRTPAPPAAFQSGSQLSVPILREIAVTLRQMDSRLERLEAIAQKLQRVRPGATDKTEKE